MGAICFKCCQVKPIPGKPADLRSQIYSYLLAQAYKPKSKAQTDEVNPYCDTKGLKYHRVSEFDSNYVTVWDGPDPTDTTKRVRVIACRGTEVSGHGAFRAIEDVFEDIKIVIGGFPDDLIHSEMRKIVEATPVDMTIDVCAHSLGTSLVLEAYAKNPGLEKRTRKTYLFNPVYTFPHTGKGQISRRFESDTDIHWFINTADVVSVEGQDKWLGGRWPKVVTLNVGHEPPFLHIRTNHAIMQWTGKMPLIHPKGFTDPCTRRATAGGPQRQKTTPRPRNATTAMSFRAPVAHQYQHDRWD